MSARQQHNEVVGEFAINSAMQLISEYVYVVDPHQVSQIVDVQTILMRYAIPVRLKSNKCNIYFKHLVETNCRNKSTGNMY